MTMDNFLKSAKKIFWKSEKEVDTKKEVVGIKKSKHELKDSNILSQKHPADDNILNAVETKGGKLKDKGKLFVGGLNYATTAKELKTYFSTFGEVIDAVVLRYPKSGKSRGFGFVTFANAEDAKKVFQVQDHFLDGRTVECRPFGKGDSKHKSKIKARVFLGGCPDGVTKEEVKQFFSRYGEVVEVFIPHNKETNKGKGFAFVTFKDEDAAKKCLADRFVYLKERRVFINKADPRDVSFGRGSECDDSKLSTPKDSEPLRDKSTKSSASGKKLIELEQHPELEELFRSSFLEKLGYYDEISDAKVENEKQQPLVYKDGFSRSSLTEDLEKMLKDVLINADGDFNQLSDSEDTNSTSSEEDEDSSSDEDDYKKNHASYSLPQGEFSGSTLEFLEHKSTSKPLPFEEEGSDSKISATGPKLPAESSTKASPPFRSRSRTSDPLICSLCQWTQPDVSFNDFLAHCKTSGHRANLKERFSALQTQENEPQSKLAMKNEKPKDVYSELRSYPTVREIQQVDSEKQVKTEDAQKYGKKQQCLSYIEQQQLLQRIKQVQLTAQQLQKNKEVQGTKQQKQEKKQSNAPKKLQEDILKDVKKDEISKPKEQKFQNLQQTPQQEPKKQITSNVNLKVYALAKGMSCIQPISEKELSCTMCNKKIPEALDFDVLMKNVSQHLQSKKHLSRLLETEELLKNCGDWPAPGFENKNSGEKKVKVKVKKKFKKEKILNESSTSESKESFFLEEQTNHKRILPKVKKPKHKTELTMPIVY